MFLKFEVLVFDGVSLRYLENLCKTSLLMMSDKQGR